MPHPLVRTAATTGAAYLLGAIPSADIAGRLATRGRVDVRIAGSGNPGALNVGTVIGPKWGAAVMVADIAKGFAACRLAGRAAGPTAMQLAGSAAVAGHCHPVWTGFRGGKGVATSVGQVLATFPAYFPLDFAVAAASVASPWFKERARASMTISSTVWVVSSAIWWRRQLPNAWGPRPTAALPVASAISAALILNRFRQESGSDNPGTGEAGSGEGCPS